MYKCRSKDCKDAAPTMTDKYVAMPYADGTPGNICRFCGKTLKPVEQSEKVQTAAINTAGCTPSSNDYTH